MKQLFVIILVLSLFSNSACQNEKERSIKGRWYFDDGSYKEVHANDSMGHFFDFKNYSNQDYLLEYKIRNDSFITFAYNKTQHFWGFVTYFEESKFILQKDNLQTEFFKIDNDDDLFTKKLTRYSINHKIDSTLFERWLLYCQDYDNRARKYYDEHPELRSKKAK